MRVLFALILTTIIAAAQEPVEDNNRKNGDAAMASQQYNDAKIYYSVGVDESCDEHSIKQLTKIWRTEVSMRLTMRYVMRKCYDCLNNYATQRRDTTAMKMLVLYYTEGIGTEKNEEAANLWKSQLQKNRNSQFASDEASRKDKTEMRFFIGYSASLLAPYGLTVGGVGKTVGGYLRFRTNLVQLPQYGGLTCSSEGLNGYEGDYAYRHLGNQKSNIWFGTGGIVFCVSSAFHLSVGGGYGKRETVCDFELIDKVETKPVGYPVWAKRIDASYSVSGAVVDLDAIFGLGKTFYCSIGGSAFNFKYVYANVGIGVFF